MYLDNAVPFLDSYHGHNYVCLRQIFVSVTLIQDVEAQ